jgi:hypothetical protein
VSRVVRILVASLIVFLGSTALAHADPVVVQSVTSSNFYTYCGNTNLTTALQPDVAPPAAPEMMCTDYTGGQATLTVRLGSHDSGSLIASAYIRTSTHPVSVRTLVNAGQTDATGNPIQVYGPSVAVANNTEGWTNLPVADVRVFDTVDVVISSSWTGAGITKVGMVHGEIYPGELGAPGNWARKPIPDTAAYEDQVDSRWPTKTLEQQVAGEVQAFAKADGSNTWINRTAYTAQFYVVPPTQPLRPVLYCRSNASATADAATDRFTSSWRPSASDQTTPGSLSGGAGLVAGHPYTVVNIVAADPSTGTPASFQLQARGATSPVDLMTDLTAAHLCIQPVWSIDNARMLAGMKRDGLTDLHGGVAVPDGVSDGAPGTDGEIVIRQPRYVHPAYPTHIGREWELWQFHLNPDFDPSQPEGAFNARFRAASGGRWSPMSISQFNSANRWWQQNIYAATEPGHPDSEWQSAGAKVTGSGLQLVNEEVSSADCSLGEIRHAIGLELPHTRYAVRWPASTSDGWNVPTLAVTEGMRLQIPASLAKPTGLTRLGNMIWDAAVKFGLTVDDQTNSSVVVRVQLNSAPCLALYDGKSSSQQINQLPFSRMRVLK